MNEEQRSLGVKFSRELGANYAMGLGQNLKSSRARCLVAIQGNLSDTPLDPPEMLGGRPGEDGTYKR